MIVREMNDGHKIPALGYGTWRVSNQDAETFVIKALEVGYRHIDTAMIYENEVGVGRAIAQSGIDREEIFVTTKLWPADQGNPEAGLATSLKKLGLDYVDLYLIHWPAPAYNLYVKAWDGLIALRDKGLATSIGVSNFHPEYLQALAPTGVVPAVNQVELHPAYANTRASEANAALGILTECYSPLGKGRDLDDSSIRSIATRQGATPAQVVLAWHLAKGYIPLPKSVTESRIHENFESEAVVLSADDVAAIDAVPQLPKLSGEPATFTGF